MFSKSTALIISAVTSLVVAAPEILEMSRGAESIARGNTGVAFSNEPNSVLQNPANGAFYGARSGLNVWGSLSTIHDLYIPGFFSDDKLYTASVGGYLEKGSLGFSVSGQFVKFKYPMIEYNNDGTQKSEKSNSFDQTFVTSTSLQFKNVVGIGASIKPVKIHASDDEIGKSFVFDLGLRGQYRKEFSEKFYINPSVGIALQNIGKDSVTGETIRAYPLAAKTVDGGISFECGMPNAFWITGEEDIAKLLVKNEADTEESPTFRTGIQIGLSPLLQLNFGNEKYDIAYTRDNVVVHNKISESHKGFTVGYRNVPFMKFLNQMSKSKEFSTDRRNFEILYSLGVVKHETSGFGEYKTYTHQISAGIELGTKKK